MSSPTVGHYRKSTSITTPTKVYDQQNASYQEETILDAIAKEVELRLQYRREHNREARFIRRKELENSIQNDDNDDESPVKSTQSALVNTSTNSGSNSNSLLLQKFLNGDIDLLTMEHRDLRRLLTEVESKYKLSMINNSSLYNDKQTLQYQIDNYKDQLDHLNETINEINRKYKEKCREFDSQKRILHELEQDHNQLKSILTNCLSLIEESEKQVQLNDNRSIDEKLKTILDEKQKQYEEIVKLKFDLEDEKCRLNAIKEQITSSSTLNYSNLNGFGDFEQQKQLTKEITNLKNRIQILETDNRSIQQENKRFDAQLTRYKQQLDESERVEDEHNQERRRLQHELRIVRDELENERILVNVLQRENERLRVLRKKELLTNGNENHVISKSHSPLEESI